MKQKVLLVGDPRICPQVAYVMDWQDYEMVEQLTDAEKYHDYKIVICMFKKQSKRLVKIKDKTLDIIYFDDICRELDKDYSLAVQVAMIEPKTPWKVGVKRFISLHGVMWLLNGLRCRITFRRQFWLKRISFKFMKTSEMLLRVLYAEPTNIVCDRLLTYSEIDHKLNIYGCCAEWTPIFGNIMQADFPTIYNSQRARIIKLSALNHSYCFCKLSFCNNNLRYVPAPIQTLSTLKTALSPRSLSVSFDHSCNLRCVTCRKDYFTADTYTNENMNKLVDTLLDSEWLQEVAHITIAGVGEVFYSNVYRRLLENLKSKEITILSNGTLFDKTQWEKIDARYDKVGVSISVDAASATTYQKIRGGNFTKLMDNLVMLGELRQQGKISNFQLNYVVQDDNYREMADFVHLAKELHVDKVNFMHLNNWGTFTKREHRKKSLLLKNGCLNRDFYSYLQKPIFNDSIVNLIAFQPYLAASAKRYNERSEISDM